MNAKTAKKLRKKAVKFWKAKKGTVNIDEVYKSLKRLYKAGEIK